MLLSPPWWEHAPGLPPEWLHIPSLHCTIVPVPLSKFGMQLWVEQKFPLSVVEPVSVGVVSVLVVSVLVVSHVVASYALLLGSHGSPESEGEADDAALAGGAAVEVVSVFVVSQADESYDELEGSHGFPESVVVGESVDPPKLLEDGSDAVVGVADPDELDDVVLAHPASAAVMASSTASLSSSRAFRVMVFLPDRASSLTGASTMRRIGPEPWATMRPSATNRYRELGCEP